MVNQTVIITGATSGMGLFAARRVAKKYPVILVARNPAKLIQVKNELARKGGDVRTVVCDFSDLVSVKQAVETIIGFHKPIIGLANNAGIAGTTGKKSKQGYELTFATDYLGPFMFTTYLLPHLEDEASVEFTVSAVEDPDRQFAVHAGFRGGRFLSVTDAANAVYKAGGAANDGFNAYATAKQCLLAASRVFAEENERLNINALELGLTLGTGFGNRKNRTSPRFNYREKLMELVAPLLKNRSTPSEAGKLIAKLCTDAQDTGDYFDEKGQLMLPSRNVQNDAYVQNIVRETRAFLEVE